ncbi:MAG TPA: hypothetical protein DCF48_07910, partial [Rikenellaceae bacterium]|nr:hypothetical protein [Rikenellaceae bacterium]
MLLCGALLALPQGPSHAQPVSRSRVSLDQGWQFALGNASSPALDFGCGTEYFNYLTKAASIHNTGPYSPAFRAE